MKSNPFKRHRFPPKIILHPGIIEGMKDYSYFNEPVKRINQKANYQIYLAMRK